MLIVNNRTKGARRQLTPPPEKKICISLYIGWLAMSLRAFPVNAITFLVYEFLLENCTRIQKHV